LSTQVAWTFATRVLMIFNSVAAGIVVARWLGADGVGDQRRIAKAHVCHGASGGAIESVAHLPLGFELEVMGDFLGEVTIGALAGEQIAEPLSRGVEPRHQASRGSARSTRSTPPMARRHQLISSASCRLPAAVSR